MLQEWAVQNEIVTILEKYDLDEESITRIRRYSREHPVIGLLEARWYLIQEAELPPSSGRKFTTMITDLEHALGKGGIPVDLEKEVMVELIHWNALPYLAGSIWQTTQSAIEPVLESVQEYLVHMGLVICRMPMLEYMMHVIASHQVFRRSTYFCPEDAPPMQPCP